MIVFYWELLEPYYLSIVSNISIAMKSLWLQVRLCRQGDISTVLTPDKPPNPTRQTLSVQQLCYNDRTSDFPYTKWNRTKKKNKILELQPMTHGTHSKQLVLSDHVFPLEKNKNTEKATNKRHIHLLLKSCIICPLGPVSPTNPHRKKLFCSLLTTPYNKTLSSFLQEGEIHPQLFKTTVSSDWCLLSLSFCRGTFLSSLQV